MPSISGSISGNVAQHFEMPVSDQSNHQIAIAEVNGTQTSADPLWNNSKISYWAFNDLVNGKGSQTGYYNNVHPDGGRDFGTFEGKVSSADDTVTVEGTFLMTGGDGQYRGITGGGRFKTVTKSTEVKATWNGAYELAKAQAG